MFQKKVTMSRRSFFKKSTAATAAVAAGSLVTNADLEAVSGNVNTNSQPSQLKITDMRLAVISPSRTVVRLDTNQGISGYGDVRSRGSKTLALMLKTRIMGMNPCNIDKIFRKIKIHGHPGVRGGGVSAVEVACWDLAGKAWGVPVWQMLGGKFRDKVRVYADTPSQRDPEEMGKRLKNRIEKHGYTYLKMDIGIRMLQGIEGTVTGTTREVNENPLIAHPFTGLRITDKGLNVMQEYCATVRDIVGWEVPIATDHFGRFGVEDCIKIAQALDKFNLAWYEDMVPWIYPDLVLMIRKSCRTPICTGEDIFCKEGFKELFEKNAIAIAHPDPAQFGGILESKKLGDLATENSVATAFHNANTLITMFASLHAAAAMEHFVAVEHHNVDSQLFHDLIASPKFHLQDGYISVPDGPGLGIEINEEALKKQMVDSKDYFLPTPEWDEEKVYDRDHIWL